MFDRAAITDSLRFWELGRIGYNIVLAVVVVGLAGHPGLVALDLHQWIALFVLAMAANVVYFAAYPVDLMVTASDYAAPWRRLGRPMLWLLGTALAAVLAMIITVLIVFPDIELPTPD